MMTIENDFISEKLESKYDAVNEVPLSINTDIFNVDNLDFQNSKEISPMSRFLNYKIFSFKDKPSVVKRNISEAENNEDPTQRSIKRRKSSIFSISSNQVNRQKKNHLEINDSSTNVEIDNSDNAVGLSFSSKVNNLKKKILNPFLPPFLGNRDLWNSFRDKNSKNSKSVHSEPLKQKLCSSFKLNESAHSTNYQDYCHNALLIKTDNSNGLVFEPKYLGIDLLFDKKKILNNLYNLISEEYGGKVIYSTDDFFGSASNLLKPNLCDPINNKIASTSLFQDSWLTRRRRCPGHDWCIIELGIPGIVIGIEISVEGLKGVNAPYCSIEGANIPDLDFESHPVYKAFQIGVGQDCETTKIISTLLNKHSQDSVDQWLDIVPMCQLNSENFDNDQTYYFIVNSSYPVRPTTHLRLNLFPDGGIRRLRVFGYGAKKIDSDKDVNLSYFEHGATVLDASDQTFGLAKNLLLSSSKQELMKKAWVTIRNPQRHPFLEFSTNGLDVTNLIGENWVIIKLAERGDISSIEIDTTHIIGNYPEKAALYVADLSDIIKSSNILEQNKYLLENDDSAWNLMLPPTLISPNKNNIFKMNNYDKRKSRGRSTPILKSQKESPSKLITGLGLVTHVKLVIYPDGAVSKLRIFGKPEYNKV